MNIQQEIRRALQYFQAGDLQQAKEICNKVLKRQPDNWEVQYFLGVIYSKLGNHDLAVQWLRKSLAFCPNNPDACHLVGMSFQEQGKIDEAGEYYRKTLQFNPNYAEAYNNLANLLKERKQTDEAISYYQKAVELKPDLGTAWYNLGVIYQEKEAYEKAAGYLKKAIQYDPRNENSYHLLGIALTNIGEIGEAIECFISAMRLNPDRADVLNNLANALHDAGEQDEAERCYHLSLAVQPHFPSCHSNLLLALNYNPRHDMQPIFNQHLHFDRLYGRVTEGATFARGNYERTTDCRLRAGYVSSDLRRHPVAYFIEPILRAHDHEQFEIFCYADLPRADNVTFRLQGLSDHWRSIYGNSDEEIANLIRDDHIDILVDLSGHTAGNRMLLFAQKLAPVQISYIGYPATTGLAAMDYKIVDWYTDPPGMTEQFYTEKLIRLPDCFLCYLPEQAAPDVNELPALKNGYITFGCFNNLAKVSHENLLMWSQILVRLPGSRLIVKAKGLSSAGVRARIADFFRQQGIEEGRIEMFSWTPTIAGHLALYHRVDIALDTFPYHGTTTTCEALWMGVPVVTLEGQTYASRVGVSLLTNVGLAELVAQTPDAYVGNALKLATDLSGLVNMRSRLRDMVSRSPLTDAKGFTTHLEKVYREMWARWCNA